MITISIIALIGAIVIKEAINQAFEGDDLI